VESDGQKEISIESKVMLYIKQNYDKPISNEELSKAFGYHPYHLNKLFKKKYGITVHQAVLNERISIAKQLLARTDLSVDGIAEIVGFSERVAFYCAFKKSEGISPNEYRTSTAADK